MGRCAARLLAYPAGGDAADYSVLNRTLQGMPRGALKEKRSQSPCMTLRMCRGAVWAEVGPERCRERRGVVQFHSGELEVCGGLETPLCQEATAHRYL